MKKLNMKKTFVLLFFAVATAGAAAQSDDLDSDIARYTEAIRRNPNDAAAYFNRGVAYFGKEDYDRAMADLNEAIRLDPNYSEAYVMRGAIYILIKGDYNRANADWEKVLQLNPDDTELREIIETLQRNGKYYY